MKPKYSKQPFNGYTHRFAVIIHKGGADYRQDILIDIYSDSGSQGDFYTMINSQPSLKGIAVSIRHLASREQDEADSRFIDEVFDKI